MNIKKNRYISNVKTVFLFIAIILMCSFYSGRFYLSGALAAAGEAAHDHRNCSHAEGEAAKHEEEKAPSETYETFSLKDRSAIKTPESHDGHNHGEGSAGHEKEAAAHGAGDGHDHGSEAAHGASAPEIKIDGLVTEKAVAETVYETVSANATVRFHPDHYAKIVPFVPGRVKQIKARLGDRVKKGQELMVVESVEIFNAKVEYLKNLNRYEVALAKYENIVQMGELGSFTQKNVEEATGSLADAKSQYEKAIVARETASKKYERVKKLVDSGVSSRSEQEQAENELRSASIEVESSKSKLENAQKSMSRVEKLSDAKISLKRETADIQTEFYEARQNYDISHKYLAVVGVECEPGGDCKIHELGTFSIYSPIDGIVIENNAVIGGSIDTQTAVMCVGDYDVTAIDIDIYEKDLSRVHNGQRVEIENIYGKTIAGRITYMSNILEQNTRTLKARAEIDENPSLLKIGEFVNCVILAAERKNAVTVPQAAVIEDGGRFLVYIKCGKSYDKVYVKQGHKFRDRVEIIEGVKPGDEVVTVGNYQLLNMSMSNKLELSCDSCK